jgi:predicted transcriptional regulator
VPIGITCRQCSRENCSQRAFDRVALPARQP